MLKIRLQRRGKKKQAFFRIVLQEHTEKLQGKYRELLGSYDPHSKEFKIDKERVDYWVSKGAQVSPTLNNLMVNNKVWDREKVQSWRPKVKEAAPEAAPTEGEKAPAEEPKIEAAAEEKKEAEAPAEEPKEEVKTEETTTEAAAAAA